MTHSLISEHPDLNYPITCERLQGFNKSWDKLGITYQNDVVSEWLLEQKDDEAICDYQQEICYQLMQVNFGKLDKADFVENIFKHIRRTQEDFFIELADWALKKNVETKKELAMLAQQEYEMERRMAA